MPCSYLNAELEVTSAMVDLFVERQVFAEEKVRFLYREIFMSVSCGLTTFILLRGISDFYFASWFVELEALSRIVMIRGVCDSPF